MEKNKPADAQSETTESKAGSTTSKKDKPVKWSPENEVIMVEWCDVAQCYKWLNTRAHAKLSVAHAWFTIPAITLSTITGTASFAQSSLPVHMQVYAPAVIGTINIFIGILSTIQQYLKISELNEAHRVSAISWDKFARNIRIELAKDPDERTEAGSFLKICRMEFDRLMETSPAIPQKVVDEFNMTFQGRPGSVERKRFDDLRKPDICNTLVTANDSRHHWYKDIEHMDHKLNDDDHDIDIELIESIKNKHEEDQSRILELVQKVKEKEEAEINMKRRQSSEAIQNEAKLKIEREKLQKYVKAFMETVGRTPHIDEVRENMKDTVSDDAIESFRSVL
ncbi:MAG: SLATT domain-containing protein [Flavobacterium sp.]